MIQQDTGSVPAKRLICCFLTPSERDLILNGLQPPGGPGEGNPVLSRFLAALRQRVNERVATNGLPGPDTTTSWYYPAAEHLSDAAMLYALQPDPRTGQTADERLANWLRTVTLAMARTPAYDWVGPWFRSHTEPFTGHLETAHICWGLSAVLSLAADVFTDDEAGEIRQALAGKGVVLCQQWLDQNTHLANWRGIMASGAVVASAALGDEETIAELMPDLIRMAQAFQPDGSYGESLQYGNYLANALMLAHESLVRAYPEQARQLDISAYGQGMGWMAQNMLYRKPLAGWGDEPRARAVNFNDSAALFRPSGDLLLHVAARCDDPVQAGLARWLFQEYYEPCPTQGPHDLATFGMRNDWGFLTLPLLTKVGSAVSPQVASLPLTTAFSNGNAFVRDRWGGKSVLAVQGGMNEGCFAPGHLQGYLNSFMLVYNRERLLADPGHSCYRNLIHGLESATQTHNTCTFLIENDTLGLQEDLAKVKLLEQRNVLPRRLIHTDGTVGPPVERGGRLLTVQRDGDVSLIVSEVGATYGPPIQEFTRCWIQVGEHVTLVLDRIRATQPVRTVWNWLLNNQDGQSIVTTTDNVLTLLRHGVGMRLWQVNDEAIPRAPLSGPVYAYLHDAYHPEPAQLGEGKSGSGLLFRFTDGSNAHTINRMHVIVADDAALMSNWQLRQDPEGITVAKGGTAVAVHQPDADTLSFRLLVDSAGYSIMETESGFTLKKQP
ncbi:MAG: heparinase II/III family protein [Bacteroidetes bacterium]|nr:heparinase II/III family protein [Fibrella sp.]